MQSLLQHVSFFHPQQLRHLPGTHCACLFRAINQPSFLLPCARLPPSHMHACKDSDHVKQETSLAYCFAPSLLHSSLCTRQPTPRNPAPTATMPGCSARPSHLSLQLRPSPEFSTIARPVTLTTAHVCTFLDLNPAWPHTTKVPSPTTSPTSINSAPVSTLRKIPHVNMELSLLFQLPHQLELHANEDRLSSNTPRLPRCLTKDGGHFHAPKGL